MQLIIKPTNFITIFPVRELTTANNILLMDLGSGPIMRASSDAGDAHGAAHMGQNRPPDSGLGNVMFSFTTKYHTHTHTKEELKDLEFRWRKIVF